MGCFGTSGFLSRIPIKYGQKVVCFIASVSNKINVRETYYPDSLVAPYCLPIHGKYNDYGCVEDIVRDANVEVIEKYFGCSIDEIINGIERLLYGNTIQENIKYWSKNVDSDGHYKEEADMYRKILPLENDLDVPYYDGKTKYQWVLLFEHEDIYNKITNIKMDSYYYRHDRITDFLENIKKYKELYDKWYRLYPTDKMKYEFFSIMPNLFESRSFMREFCWSRLDTLEEESAKNNDSVEIKKELEDTYKMCDEVEELLKKISQYSPFMHEGRSYAFMGLFKQITDIDDLFNLYINCKDEILKFYNIWHFCNTIPMHIGLSHTGSQEYNYDLFKKFNALIDTTIDNLDDAYISEDSIKTSYLVGYETEDGKVMYQRETLGGYTFSEVIDNETCQYETKDDAWDECEKIKDHDCYLWQIDERTTVKAIDY